MHERRGLGERGGGGRKTFWYGLGGGIVEGLDRWVGVMRRW